MEILTIILSPKEEQAAARFNNMINRALRDGWKLNYRAMLPTVPGEWRLYAELIRLDGGKDNE